MKESFTTGDGRTLAYTRTGTGPRPVCHAGETGFSAATLGDLGGRFELYRTPAASSCRTRHFVWFDEPDRFREEVTRFLLEE